MTGSDYVVFRNSGCDTIFPFIFEPIITACHQGLSSHYAILIASPYLDGAATTLKDLDAFMGGCHSTAFIMILTDQHNYGAPSSFIRSITTHKWTSLYGVIVDSGFGKRSLSMHCKLYVSYRYAPAQQSIAKLLKSRATFIKTTLVKAVRSTGSIIDNINAFYQPISACMGSANFTATAMRASDQQEIMIRANSNHFVDRCRIVFADVLAAYKTPVFYGF